MEYLINGGAASDGCFCDCLLGDLCYDHNSCVECTDLCGAYCDCFDVIGGIPVYLNR